MAHEVESLAYVSRHERDVPWHRLGTPVCRPMSQQQVLRLAGLDWRVECRPVYTQRTDGSLFAHPGQVAVLRDMDDRVYRIADADVRPVQPKECVAFVDELAATGQARFDTAGSLRDGAVLFLSARLDRDLRIGGQDHYGLYLLVRTSYDGSLAFGVDVSPVRTVCMNTVNLSLRRARASWSTRRPTDMATMASQARQALERAHVYVDTFEQTLEQYAAVPFGLRDFERLTRRLSGPLREQRDPGRVAARSALIQLFETSPTLDAGLRYTTYGALQTLIEHHDWAITGDSSGRDGDENRVERVLGWRGEKARSLRRAMLYLQQHADRKELWPVSQDPANRGATEEKWPSAGAVPATADRAPATPGIAR